MDQSLQFQPLSPLEACFSVPQLQLLWHWVSPSLFSSSGFCSPIQACYPLQAQLCWLLLHSVCGICLSFVFLFYLGSQVKPFVTHLRLGNFILKNRQIQSLCSWFLTWVALVDEFKYLREKFKLTGSSISIVITSLDVNILCLEDYNTSKHFCV